MKRLCVATITLVFASSYPMAQEGDDVSSAEASLTPHSTESLMLARNEAGPTVVVDAPPRETSGQQDSERPGEPRLRFDVFGGGTLGEGTKGFLGWESGLSFRFLPRVSWLGVAGAFGHARGRGGASSVKYYGVGPSFTTSFADDGFRVFGNVMFEDTFKVDAPTPLNAGSRFKTGVGLDWAIIRFEGTWRRASANDNFGLLWGIAIPICGGGKDDDCLFRIF